MSDPELIFDHVGIPTDEAQSTEDWVDATKVWVTNPRRHKFRIEYLRYRADSPVREELKGLPHVAYQCRAEDFDELMRGGEVLAEPFAADANLTVGFILKNGVPIEYMVYKERGLWFGKTSQ